MKHAMTSIGFVGGGRATRFLLHGWKNTGGFPARIIVTDPNAESLAQLERFVGPIQTADFATVAKCDVVFLATHPPVVRDVLAQLESCVCSDTVVVSLAPKVSISQMGGVLKTPSLVRMIPNAPSAVGKGFNPASFAPNFDPDLKKTLLSWFARWGECPEVAEETLEAYAVISAMGPTYMWFQWQALGELGVEFGLDPAEADRALRKMVEGAAALFWTSGWDAGTVSDLIPVHPLKAAEESIRSAYQERLRALFAKLKS